MAAVEDTRDARERAVQLLTEVARGVIVRTTRTVMPYSRPLSERSPRLVPLDDREQHAMILLRLEGLVDTNDGREAPVWLTSKGRAFLTPPAATDDDTPAVPPLLCDSTSIHGTDRPRAVAICADTSGTMRTMAQCADCVPQYAINAAQTAVSGFGIFPAPEPVAIHLIPLPQVGTP